MSDLCFLAAYELRELLLRRELSARELWAAFRQQIEQTNGQYNALVTLDFEGAEARARALDVHLARHSEPLGLLHGLPVAVKDVFATEGLRTTYGNVLYAEHVPEQDDLLVQRERAAGALIIGKSNTPDCASGGRTRNELFGLTRNPWNPDKTCSGSGGGGVAALAAGMVALADGSDIGGSVRSPAAWTQCVGFRPSSGRIPGPPGSMADGDTSTAGIFARCVADVALFMAAVDGPDLGSATAYPHQRAGFPETLPELDRPVRLAWDAAFADREVIPEIAQAFEAHRPLWRDLGCEVLDAPVPLGAGYRQLYTDFNAYGYLKGLPPRVLAAYERGEPIKPSIASNLQRYQRMSAEAIHQMYRARAELRVRVQQFMQQHDILITPAHGDLAYGAEDEAGEAACDWSAFYLAPLLGLPSVVIPSGLTSDGMPHGVMLSARYGEDALLLQVAQAFERRTAYWRQRAI